MLKLCTYNQSGLKFIPGLLIFYHILSKLIAKLNLSIIFLYLFYHTMLSDSSHGFFKVEQVYSNFTLCWRE